MSKNIKRSSLEKSYHEVIKQKDIQKIDIQNITHHQEKLRSQRKYRLSQRNPYVTNKVTLDNEPLNHKKLSGYKNRIKTEMDQSLKIDCNRSNIRSPYSKHLSFRWKRIPGINDQREESLKKLDLDSKFKQFQKVNNQRLRNPFTTKKAFFLGDINIKGVKKQSQQRSDWPLTGKNLARITKNSEKTQQSYGQKLQTISQHLQKLNLQNNDEIKKKTERTLQKQKIAYNSLINEQTTNNLNNNNNKKSPEKIQLKIKIQKFEPKIKRIKTQTDDESEPLQPIYQNNEKSRISRKNKNPFDLSHEEIEIFGDRFPQSFQKIKLLGRGGFSLVWLGEHKKSKKQFAVKQIKTENNHQTHIKEIWFGTYFFQMGGIPKKEFLKHIGIKNLVKLYSYDINRNDTWIFYQKCGESLGNALYELKGQNFNSNERIYRAIYKPFYHHIRKNQNQIRKIIIEVAKALVLLTQNKIVHSDLKTQNILVKMRSLDPLYNLLDDQLQSKESILDQIKLIDYGSSFTFGNLKQFSMATPEYMAPQILNYILYQNEMEYAPKLLEFLQIYQNPWTIDIWSLGCVLLEIISGIPLWMSLKTILRRNNKEQITYGLFAVKGRLFDKIIQKQIETIQNLEYFLSEKNYSEIILEDDLKQALARMLAIDPSTRISPSQLITLLSSTYNN